MIIYKETSCPDCGIIITLEYNGKEYRGYCPACDKEIIESAYGDENEIEEKYGR